MKKTSFLLILSLAIAAQAQIELLDDETIQKVRNRNGYPLPVCHHHTPFADHGPCYFSIQAGAAITPDVETNAGPIHFDPSEWLSVQAGLDITPRNDWGLVIEPEFSFYQPNAHIESIFGIKGFDGKADLDSYNLALNVLGRWNFAERWSLHFGIGPVYSHLEASNAHFIVAGVSLPSANADDSEFGFQTSLGVKYFISDNWALVLESRFLRTNDYHLQFPAASITTPLETYVTSLGVACYF